MTVKLIKPWGLNAAGTILDLPESTVQALLLNPRKVAVVLDSKKTSKKHKEAR